MRTAKSRFGVVLAALCLAAVGTAASPGLVSAQPEPTPAPAPTSAPAPAPAAESTPVPAPEPGASAEPAPATEPAPAPATEPAPAPAGAHQIRYTLTSGGAAPLDLYYLAIQPPDKQAYDADPYAYLKKESVTLAPGVPWVFDTTLDDPSWAILTVSSTTRGGQAAPNPHCEIAVDGQLAVQQSAPYNLQCQLKTW